MPARDTRGPASLRGAGTADRASVFEEALATRTCGRANTNETSRQRIGREVPAELTGSMIDRTSGGDELRHTRPRRGISVAPRTVEEERAIAGCEIAAGKT